jgi:hypothetical protein
MPCVYKSAVALRELVASSPVSGAAGAQTAITFTLTVQDDGNYHLGRAAISAAGTTDAVGPINLGATATIKSLLVNGTTEFIQGNNTPEPPLALFSPSRGINALGGANGLPSIPLSSGDTIAVTCQTNSDTSPSATYSLGVPFTPENSVGHSLVPNPGQYAMYLGSPNSGDISSGGSTTVTCTASMAGIVDMTSLAIRAEADPSTNVSWSNAASACHVTAISMAGGRRLLTGQNTPALGADFFGAERKYSFAALGVYEISASQTIAITISNNWVDTVQFSFGARFWPESSMQYCPPPKRLCP